MRQLRDCVPGAFVDRAGNFSTLNVNDADVHVSSSESGGQSLVTITDQHNDVRLQAMKFTGKFD